MNTSIKLQESLHQKLARLSANNEYSNKSADELLTPFPLDAFLALYNKAHSECYVNYMEGAKLLNAWLSPILSPPTYEVDIACKYPTINSYDIQRLGIILGVKQSIIIEAMIRVIAKEGDSQ